MKIYLKLMIFALVLGLAGPFFLKRPDGRPWLEVDDFLPDMSAIGARAENGWSWVVGRVEDAVGEENLDLPSGKTKVYKWRAADGSWQFSDKPPPEGAEEVWLDPSANVMQSTPLPASVSPSGEKEDANPLSNGIPLPLSVAPGKVSKLMDDAKNVQKLVEQRNQKLEDAFNDARPSDD